MTSTSHPQVLPHSLKRERDDGGSRQEMIGVEIPFSTAFHSPARKDHAASRSRSSSLSDISDSHAPSPPGMMPSSAAPSAFDAMNGPPPKKPKLTFQQKEQEKAFKMIEKQNKERERAEEKAKKAAEKEAERKKKDEERQAKEEERRKAAAEKEEKRLVKEQEKQRKAAEQQRIEDEKKKKDASQKKLSAFFGAPSQPKPAVASSKAVEDVPKVKDVSEYEKAFPPFWYNTEHTTVAPETRFARDHEATRNLHIRLDRYISEPQTTHSSFNAEELFHIPINKLRQRGRQIRPVREIMTESTGSLQRPIDLTATSSTSQNSQTRSLINQLRAIPMKILKFHEDVRPPYIGTRTSISYHELSKLARTPCKKMVEQLDYEYDSEAEWMEPEEGEELLSGDEEEEEDEEEEMDDFLDDSEAAPLQGGVASRGNLATNMEIESTGLCWEDANGTNANATLYGNRLEILHHEKFNLPIDPFSTAYWAMNPPRRPLANKGTNSTLTTPLPSDPFSAAKTSTQTSQTSQTSQSTSAHDAKADKLVRPEDMDAFKATIKGNGLSQVGLIEVLHLTFPNNTKAVVKNTLLRVAAKEKGKGGVWKLI